jgi:archaellum component FlaC
LSLRVLEFAWRGLDQPPFASELRARWERGEREQARYLTIGVAFYGNRNNAKTITCTRFLITDGSRLEKDIPTMQEIGNGKQRACDLRTFKKNITEHGLICENQPEYEQKVMQYLFRFTESNDFHRLLRQLLYLRQPNLNSILSLDAVRAFLDQSLPALPNDLVQHAATTLELMDSLENEIKNRKDAYTAVERLHHAQQTVCLTQTRLAACDYLYSQFHTQHAQNEVSRLKRALTRAENDLKRTQTQIDELEHERVEVAGQIAALEDSEGLQAAKKLNRTEETLKKCKATLLMQQQLLEDVIQRREKTDEAIQAHRQEFERMYQQSSKQLTDLQQLAEQVAHWTIAAEQLATTLQQVQIFFLETTTPPVAIHLSSLQKIPLQERLNWLDRLKLLHHQIQQNTIELDVHQREETAASEALDIATRAFESERESVCQAQQNLADHLDLLLDQSEWQASLLPLREQANQIWNAPGSLLEEIVEQLGMVHQGYQREIQQLLSRLKTASKGLQQHIEQLRGQQGAQNVAVEQAWAEYEKKRLEPEHVPGRSDHRIQARQVLEDKSIPALPLYMLLDVVPEGEHLAGSIEHMLEDAGLLDALVVLPEHTTAADTLLNTAGLSDCRLEFTPFQANPVSSLASRNLLRSDPALPEIVGEQAARWDALTQALLPTLEQTLTPIFLSQEVQSQSIQWRHGLLTGRAGTGNPRCLGRATRLREQQQVLTHLHDLWEELERQLQALTQQIEQQEKQRQIWENTQNRLGEIWRTSGVEQQYTQLKTALNTLQQANKHYQQQHQKSQQLRQHIMALRRTLQQDTEDVPLFSGSVEKVEQADKATRQLASEQRTLQNYLEQLRTAWQEYHRGQNQLHKDKAAEWRAAEAHRSAILEEKQARAELETLLKLIQKSEQDDGEDLVERLQRLQKRSEELPGALQTARERHTNAKEALKNSQGLQEPTQSALEKAQRRHNDMQQRFLAQFEVYPVDILLTLKLSAASQTALEQAKTLLEFPLEMEEETYTEQKTNLEDCRRREQNDLLTIAHEVNNRLHDYGPQPDEQGIIRFQNADRANASELLNRLSEEINYQQGLLEARERELFQNFLLEELADTIGKHITDAEDWVKKMNTILDQTAFVGSHYYLRWSPKKEEEAGGPPSHPLAHYHDLLRRQAQTFKQEEIDQLVYAFRQEVDALRSQTYTTDATNFSEALAHTLDYRDWFQFEIFINRPDGTPLHLTNRFFKKGSGAEQYVTLYIPFFAALSALYDSAGQGAPRLIALDEAFDKVSVENTRQLLTFLAKQQFQWIMTGPAVTGEGADIPACVKYTMFCDRERELAAGFPAFWSFKAPQGAEI